MPHRHTPSSDPHGNWLLGPRAIAVFSCTLAMLAASPAMASSRRAETIGVVATLDQLPSTTLTSAVQSTQGSTPKSRKASRLPAQSANACPTLHSSHDLQMLKALAQWNTLLTRQLAALITPHQHLAFIPTNLHAIPLTPQQINIAHGIQAPRRS